MTLILSGTNGVSDVDGTAAAPAIRGTDSNTGIFFPAADTIAFSEGGVESMRIDSSGNVGIGTSSPGTRLDIGNGNINMGASIFSGTGVSTADCAFEMGGARTGSGNCYIDMHAVAGTDYEARILRFGGVNGSFQIFNTGTGDFQFVQQGAGVLIFATSNNERMRVTSGGEVYIAGTTDQGAYNLQVNGTGVWAAGVYVNGSDARLKENVQDLGNALDVVNAMRPVTFQYKADYSKDTNIQPGFIAQELQTAMAGKPYLDGVVQAGPNHLSVAYQTLIPVLTKAIQELTARVVALEAK